MTARVPARPSRTRGKTRVLVIRAVRDDLVEPLMGLAPQILDSRWTGHSGRITLTGAYGDRLLTVPVWDMFIQRSG